MMTIAPMSSTIASVSRKTLSELGTPRPTSATTPTAKAMSVAIGIPQPVEPAPPALKAAYSAAGTAIPPTAAIAGKAAAAGLRKWPATSSCLISRPTTKKNSTINASLIHSSKGLSSTSRPPNSTRV